MNFKKWPYWVRGGIIFNIITLIIGIILVLFGGEMVHTPVWIWVLLPSFLLYPSFSGDDLTRMILFSIIIYFIFGSIVGWLYGKIKNRKTNSQSLNPKP